MKFVVEIEVHNKKQNSQAVEMVDEFCRELSSRMPLKSCSCKIMEKSKPKKVERKNGE